MGQPANADQSADRKDLAGDQRVSFTFTPGPWRVERSPKRKVLCVFGGPSFNTWICGELQADNDTRIDTGECIANARLIAAAPDMLKALVAIVENGDGSSNYCSACGDAFDLAKDAIAKATVVDHQSAGEASAAVSAADGPHD